MLLKRMSAAVPITKSPVSYGTAAPATRAGAARAGHKGLTWKRPSTADGQSFMSSGRVGQLRDC